MYIALSLLQDTEAPEGDDDNDDVDDDDDDDCYLVLTQVLPCPFFGTVTSLLVRNRLMRDFYADWDSEKDALVGGSERRQNLTSHCGMVCCT